MRVAILLVVGISCACGPSLQPGAGEVTLAVEPANPSPGDSVSITLRNGSGAALHYNLCASGLERQTNGGWETVPSERVCTMELRTLEPSADASFALELPNDLQPGGYRFRTSVEILDSGERNDVTSDPFRVES